MNNTLWKYLDFWKFQSMLEKGMHFRRSDLFVDPFEGHFAWGTGIKAYLDARLIERNQQENKMPGYSYLLLKLQEFERKKKSTFISSWQNDEYESEAMWRLYTAIHKNVKSECIVLKTNMNRLEETLKTAIQPYNLEIGSVEYLESYGSEDYSDISNSIFFKKRKCFSYENEVRAVFGYKRFTDSLENEENLFYKVDLNHLIEEIRISPFLGDDFMAQLLELLKKNNLSIPVRKSEILMQPEFSITETLTKLSNHKESLGDQATKTIKLADSYANSIIITERFNNVEKEYLVKLNNSK